MEEMFCFQCEQTKKGEGCDYKVGVCGKTADTANLQDELTAELIGLAKATVPIETEEQTDFCMMESLFMTVTNVNFDNRAIKTQIKKVIKEKERLLPGCNTCQSKCGRVESYDMETLWSDNEDIRSLKSMILFGVRGMAAYAFHAYQLGFQNKEVSDFFYKALCVIGEDLPQETLLEVVLETGQVNLKCMELLDKANTESYGVPEPTEVSMIIEKGPFIVISGHDLHDLYLLLEQTKGRGVNIYTHSEMLPAHGYPKLKAYPHLKGNFGTAWQNQQKEFKDMPGAVLFTTNCIMPPRDNYKDRIFTTHMVGYEGLTHVTNRDFSPVIERALELGGYQEEITFQGVNGGTSVTTGFSHGTVLGVADKVVEAVKKGEISHFFLVGGCDGAAPGRNYYTDFVKQTPTDSVILTLACGKYRFNDLDLGTVAGLPRIMDMGQCNDAYSAIVVAKTLAEVFDCSVNELPLSLVLSWFEQKAVVILLSLLALGIKNIVLGPTLPAFISSNVLNLLVEKFEIAPTTTPEVDLKRLLKK